MDVLILGGIWYAVFVASAVAHEVAHGLVALKLGDPTAQREGLLTLNPAPHIRRESTGMVVVPIVSFWLTSYSFMLGWASVPIDPVWARDHHRRAALTALAGPLANLALVVVAALAIRAGIAAGIFGESGGRSFDGVARALDPGWTRWLALGLSILFSLNLLLCAFNLLPVPPLDGSTVILFLLPKPVAGTLQGLMRLPLVDIIGMIAAFFLVRDYFASWVFHPAFRLLYP